MGIKFPNQDATYVGCVLATRERNYYDDSDFYAIVWDEKSQSVISVEYATTRFGGGGDATVDATPEVIEKVKAYFAPIIARRAIVESQAIYDQKVKDFKAFHTGVTVKVKRTIKSRKQGIIPEGFTGVLVWRGEPYHYHGDPRYGVKSEDGRCVFVNAGDIEYAGREPTADDIYPPATMENDYDRILSDVKERLKVAKGYTLGHYYALSNPRPGLVVM